MSCATIYWLLRAMVKSLAVASEHGPKKKFSGDTRSYGGVPHGGFGLGVDRVCSWLTGADHIREVIPFPRDSRRVTP